MTLTEIAQNAHWETVLPTHAPVFNATKKARAKRVVLGIKLYQTSGIAVPSL